MHCRFTQIAEANITTWAFFIFFECNIINLLQNVKREIKHVF